MLKAARLVLIAFVSLFSASLGAARASEGADDFQQCVLDAMLIFDASGSMAGTDWNGQVSRISYVRNALERVLPEVTPHRRLGLISYGPGPYNKCDNIRLHLKPGFHTPRQILERVDALIPAGRTPLTAAVERAAEVMQHRSKPAVIVLLTDGEETCGGEPCDVARSLKQVSADITVHVISYMHRTVASDAGLSQSRCIAGETGGIQVTVENEVELISALRKTLACPVMTNLALEP